MKVITKMELQPDMVLGEDILDQDRVIYPAGTTVTPQIIEKLKRYNLICVTIMEDVDFANTHYEKIRFDSNFKAFERAYPIFLGEYKLAMKQLLIMGRKPADIVLLTIYKELSYYISSGSALLDYLYNLMPSEDELTYTQGLNAALLAGAFADWLSMSEDEKNTLILCGFYYDIGKLQLPYELLWKPGKLTDAEFKIIKTHPVVGYTTVRNQDLNEHVKNAVILVVLYIVTYFVREIMESKCMGDRMGIAPFTMLAVIYVGILVYGVVGFILGPISYCIIKALVLYLKSILEHDKL